MVLLFVCAVAGQIGRWRGVEWDVGGWGAYPSKCSMSVMAVDEVRFVVAVTGGVFAVATIFVVVEVVSRSEVGGYSNIYIDRILIYH